jgi:predicted DNA-binding transcriptional regulator YafY
MRADRLLSTLLLLQQRGRVTVQELARELEISERTARRDLQALSAAGVPVYSLRGRGGGWQLVGGARTDLSGMTAPEVRALFMTAASSAQTEQSKRALAKLRAALPSRFQSEADLAAQSMFIDLGTSRSPEPPAQLGAVQEVIALGRRAELHYLDRQGAASHRIVDPLGVVLRGNNWYLVADGKPGRRTFRIDRINQLTATNDPVQRPEGFDLAESWRELVGGLGSSRWPARATVLVASWALKILRLYPGILVLAVGDAAHDGRYRVELAGPSEFVLAAQLAGLVSALEVTDPPTLRRALSELGVQLTLTYA